MVDFVEICTVYLGKMIIKAAKRIFNSDKTCCGYSDLSFGVTFLEHRCSFMHVLMTFCYHTSLCSACQNLHQLNVNFKRVHFKTAVLVF